MPDQIDLFGAAPPDRPRPGGFRYAAELIDAVAERELVARIGELPLREFEFHGYTGKRRVLSFGWRYDFAARRLDRVDDIPGFLQALRERVAPFAGVAPESLQQVLVSEYAAGAGIGWHRDKPEFGEVVGVSLLAPCTFRLRRRARDAWERVNLVVEPRSAYLLAGAARDEWEHSIPPVDRLRYSVTFRNLRAR